MAYLRCEEKYGALVDEVLYVIVSVRLYENRKLKSVRLHRFHAAASIETIKEVLLSEYEADYILYQPFLPFAEDGLLP